MPCRAGYPSFNWQNRQFCRNGGGPASEQSEAVMCKRTYAAMGNASHDVMVGGSPRRLPRGTGWAEELLREGAVCL